MKTTTYASGLVMVCTLTDCNRPVHSDTKRYKVGDGGTRVVRVYHCAAGHAQEIEHKACRGLGCEACDNQGIVPFLMYAPAEEIDNSSDEDYDYYENEDAE